MTCNIIEDLGKIEFISEIVLKEIKKYLSLSVKNYKQSKKINEIYIFKENIVNFKKSNVQCV